jgi:hypothetical protein
MISYSVCVPLCLLGKSFTLYKRLSFDFMFMKNKTISNGYSCKVKTNLEACYFTQLHAHYTLVPTFDHLSQSYLELEWLLPWILGAAIQIA